MPWVQKKIQKKIQKKTWTKVKLTPQEAALKQMLKLQKKSRASEPRLDYADWLWGIINDDDDYEPWDGPENFNMPLLNEFGWLPWAVIDISIDRLTGAVVFRGMMRNGVRCVVVVSRHEENPLEKDQVSDEGIMVMANGSDFLKFDSYMGDLKHRLDPTRGYPIHFPQDYRQYLSNFDFKPEECSTVFQTLSSRFADL